MFAELASPKRRSREGGPAAPKPAYAEGSGGRRRANQTAPNAVYGTMR